MDNIDRELLALLAKDARRPASELARMLEVSRATIQNRIDRLQKTGLIKAFTIEMGEQADAVLVEALVLLKLTSGDSRRTIDQLKRMDEVETLTSANGLYDFIMDVRVSSLQRLDDILMQIRRMPMVAETHSSIRLKRFK